MPTDEGAGGEGEAVAVVEQPTLEAKKPMYDVVMELTGAGGHKALVHQLIMVSALGRSAAESAAGKAELGERHKKLFEAPPDTIGEITTYITDLKSEGILGTTKILYSHDIPTPMFPAFEYRVLTTSSHTEFKTVESADMVVAEYVATISKLAQFVSGHGADLSAALDAVQQEAPQLLGTQGMLEFFTRLGELDSITEFRDRLTMYLHVKMDDDIVWPHPQRLYPYD